MWASGSCLQLPSLVQPNKPQALCACFRYESTLLLPISGCLGAQRSVLSHEGSRERPAGRGGAAVRLRWSSWIFGRIVPQRVGSPVSDVNSAAETKIQWPSLPFFSPRSGSGLLNGNGDRNPMILFAHFALSIWFLRTSGFYFLSFFFPLSPFSFSILFSLSLSPPPTRIEAFSQADLHRPSATLLHNIPRSSFALEIRRDLPNLRICISTI